MRCMSHNVEACQLFSGGLGSVLYMFILRHAERHQHPHTKTDTCARKRAKACTPTPRTPGRPTNTHIHTEL
jgi:hypothetical protein